MIHAGIWAYGADPLWNKCEHIFLCTLWQDGILNNFFGWKLHHYVCCSYIVDEMGVKKMLKMQNLMRF